MINFYACYSGHVTCIRREHTLTGRYSDLCLSRLCKELNTCTRFWRDVRTSMNAVIETCSTVRILASLASPPPSCTSSVCLLAFNYKQTLNVILHIQFRHFCKSYSLSYTAVSIVNSTKNVHVETNSHFAIFYMVLLQEILQLGGAAIFSQNNRRRLEIWNV